MKLDEVGHRLALIYRSVPTNPSALVQSEDALKLMTSRHCLGNPLGQSACRYTPRDTILVAARVRVPCDGCGIQYDRREIEEYSHPHALHVLRFVCPKGHLCEARRLWEPALGDAADQ